MDILNNIEESLVNTIRLREQVLEDKEFLLSISQVALKLTEALKRGNKILICGNGGSAADAQHIASELAGRYLKDRRPLPVEALHVNTSSLTAIANDYGYEEVYARLTEAYGKEGDVLWALSTSGNSPNLVRALDRALSLNIYTIGFTGKTEGAMDGKCNLLLKFPSVETPRIQELHLMTGHILAGIVEELIFGETV